MVETNLPIMFLRDLVILPYNEFRLEISTEYDKTVFNISANTKDGYLLFVNLVDTLEEKPDIISLPKVAILAKIKSSLTLPNGSIRAVVMGIDRVEVLNYIDNDTYLEAFVKQAKEYDYDENEAEALRRMLIRNLKRFVDVSPYMTNTVLGRINNINNIGRLSDIVVSELTLEYKVKLKYIEAFNAMNRMRMLIKDLEKEIETIKLEQDIEDDLSYKLDLSQKEYILREKIKLIKEKLGDTDIKEQDVDNLRNKLNSGDYPDKVRRRLEEEIDRYEMSSSVSPEVTTTRNYIDYLINLPWNIKTEDNDDLVSIGKCLNKSHYGLDKIKTRILEYIAVKKNTKNNNVPIICLVGPPGVGKTTLAKEIANALNKKFVKMSVGGINDEAEIIGHRKTYIGASPGKIIQGIKKAGSNNPVFLIDEIDKMTKDYKGDPASALLDILDKEQNSMFCDNYIEEEFDLSNVMFILTANDGNLIPLALKDRLEIIELSSYTLYEKEEICKKYLIPKLLKEHNINKNNVFISDDGIEKIIMNYTKEAGVRELERQIAKICRKIVIDLVSNKQIRNYMIGSDNLEEYLGLPKYNYIENDIEDKSGIVNGLAYTSYGGCILKVSSTYYKGDGKIILTGSLGEVMKESAYIALSYIKSNANIFGIDEKIFKNVDIHINFEEGAVPKDGPSAGVTLVTTLISMLKNTVISNNISMTGEITLRGKVLPIGGLKEKLIAASINNINKVFIPIENKNDLDEIPKQVKDKIQVILVKDYMDIYKEVF